MNHKPDPDGRGSIRSSNPELIEAALASWRIAHTDFVKDFMFARHLVGTKGKSNRLIWIELNSTPWDFQIEFYYHWNPFSSEIAVTKGNLIRLNRWRVKDPMKSLGTIAHEWTHILGYSHSFRNSPERDFTVPYSFGIAVEEYRRKFRVQ